MCIDPDYLHLCVGRRLGDQIPSHVRELLEPPNLAFLVFPQVPDEASSPTPSTDISTVLSVSQAKQVIQEWKRQSPPNNTGGALNDTAGKIVLLALDATWKYAKEMHRANLQGGHYPPALRRLAIVPHSNIDDGSSPPADLPVDFQPRRFLIRTTPSSSSDSGADTWMCTAECLAWIATELKTAVTPPSDSPSLYDTILEPLDLMVQQWNACMEESRHKGANKKQKIGEGPMPPEPSND
eukprot:Nitzschia sp. Nitz4//scaffold463_size5986//4161//4877//NITZ4_009196-RA/size5986-processed-gene-0.7-mRNA-1//-1//CDS//3329552504//3630//frame0